MDEETGRRGAPTISEVADAAGVSRATVSRAFTRPGMLSPGTVARVREVAGRIGYVPNQVARALSTGRHGNIALIVPDVANPFFPPLIRGAQARADLAGYCLFLGSSDEAPEREETLVAKFAGQVEGLILVSSRLPEERIRAFAERRPIVVINRDVSGLPRVLIDTARGIAAAVDYLADLGHRRITYVTGPAASWSNQQRRHAVRRAARRRGIEMIALPAHRASFEAGREAVPEILATGATAAIAFDDVTAQGVLVGLAERRIPVPERFSVIGCDDVLGATTFPPLTTVSARCDEAGEMALDLLEDQLAGRGLRDIRCVLDTRLVVRGSAGPAPAA
ncbi:LacI family transcriptional regulator [Alsobacter sp. SYSU M60028]|uniref:LacI family transcriptional regulator n=1 Tax=Alsobacter ponti TaxID=2962936 RepID=A0ABT1LCT6_9HYPH|nr:LacI family DNA-binding transcriptional regulator [Alsobacter ponti]MCP8939317.1 LacI family transcriptional regulator [Alsobacter ponti]